MRSKTFKSLLTVALFFSAIMIFMPIVSAADIYVPDNYARIQWAIDNATARDTIYVSDGLYHENVVVNKQLNLIGIGLPTVDAGGNNSTIKVTADDCLIEGFNATGSGGDHEDAGICVSSGNNIIKNNIANSNGGSGIYVNTGDSNNTITANIASNNGGNGIYVHWSSNNNTITNNTASNNYNGIRLSSSDNNIVTANIANSNRASGIRLGESNNNIVTANIANSNRANGIYLLSGPSSNNVITANTVSSNNYGIYLRTSNNNMIYNNYFNNTNNAYDDGNNIWNITKTVGTNIIGGSWLGGNYWSDYAGIDANGDGLGDSLLPCNSNGEILVGGDMHPLAPVGIAPLLSIEKLVNSDPVPPGGTLDYSIIVNNVGYITTTNVTVTETYDMNVIYDSAIPAPSVGDNTWIFPALNANETKWINISVTVNSSTPIETVLHNIVNVTCDQGVMDTDTEATTVFYGEPNCTCGDMCVVTTGWWRDGCAFHPSDTPIQDAIDNAGTGDTICVKDGMYNENVVVNKQLNLIGIGLPTVDAGGNNSAIEVTADVCLIEGFNVTGSGDDHGDAGICVRSDNNIIKNNIANSNGECGIYLSTSTYSNNVIANTASDNNMGIYLHWSSNYNTITNNTVNSNSYSGIHLLSVDNNKVTANMISYNQYAIHLWGASNNKVTANIIAYNRYGIYLFSDSDNNTITSNTISSNSRCGIHLDDASNINNLIYNNYFNNTKNAYGDGNNIWNSTKTAGTNIIGGPYLGGNYWSDYAGEDLDGDGLGDTLLPYNSSGDITSGGDVLPLIKVAQKSMALISTDKFRYSPGDPMTITISISKPTEDNVTFQWYWVVPQYNVSFPVMSVFTSADYFGTFNLRIPTPGFGLKPPGNLFYVQLLDNTIGEVLDADATCWTCTPSGEVMPPERIVEQINETIERMELP